jgi:hypothetical protein
MVNIVPEKKGEADEEKGEKEEEFDAWFHWRSMSFDVVQCRSKPFNVVQDVQRRSKLVMHLIVNFSVICSFLSISALLYNIIIID